jgi:hypothetical protein
MSALSTTGGLCMTKNVFVRSLRCSFNRLLRHSRLFSTFVRSKATRPGAWGEGVLHGGRTRGVQCIAVRRPPGLALPPSTPSGGGVGPSRGCIVLTPSNGYGRGAGEGNGVSAGRLTGRSPSFTASSGRRTSFCSAFPSGPPLTSSGKCPGWSGSSTSCRA